MRISVLRHKNVEGTDMTHERMNDAYASIVAPHPPSASYSAGHYAGSSMPFHAMSVTELQPLATSLNVTLPKHILALPVREHRGPLIAAISAYYSANPAGKGGKKKRTLKKKRK